LPTKLTVATVAGVIGLLSGGLGLVFDAFPTLRPDPRTDLGSDAAVLSVDRYVSNEDYLRRRYPDPKDYAAARRQVVSFAGGAGGLAIRGEVVYTRISLRGLTGRNVLLQLAIYDARRNVRTAPAKSVEHWTGDAPTDSFISEAWLAPVLGEHRQFFVRAEVRDAHGVLLALADSRPFLGLSEAAIY
jgi:hypothetical protein